MELKDVIELLKDNDEAVNVLNRLGDKLDDADRKQNELIDENKTLRKDLKISVDRREDFKSKFESIESEFEAYKSDSDKKDWVSPDAFKAEMDKKESLINELNSKIVGGERESMINQAIASLNIVKEEGKEDSYNEAISSIKTLLSANLKHDAENGHYYSDANGEVVRSTENPTKNMSVLEKANYMKENNPLVSGLIKHASSSSHSKTTYNSDQPSSKNSDVKLSARERLEQSYIN